MVAFMGVVPPRLNAPPPNSPGLPVALPNCPGVKPEPSGRSPPGNIELEFPMSGGVKPNPSMLDERVQSICVSVWFIVAWCWEMVLPRVSVRPSVDSWFAVIPAGMEIIIAMEKPKAIITNKALILRLEIFLTALVTMPNFIHLSKHSRKRQPKRENGREGLGCLFLAVFVGNTLVTMFLSVFTILPFGCLHAQRGRIIKPFFRIVPNSVPNLIIPSVRVWLCRKVRIFITLVQI